MRADRLQTMLLQRGQARGEVESEETWRRRVLRLYRSLGCTSSWYVLFRSSYRSITNHFLQPRKHPVTCFKLKFEKSELSPLSSSIRCT